MKLYGLVRDRAGQSELESWAASDHHTWDYGMGCHTEWMDCKVSENGIHKIFYFLYHILKSSGPSDLWRS